MNILFVGGGSGGPVAPLLAIAKQIRKQHDRCEFLLVGTSYGPESGMAAAEHMPFRAIVSGKLRRYFSWRNFFSPLLVVLGFFQSCAIVLTFKPQVVIGVGSFVQVPVVWAAFILRIPVLLHQQDVYPSLANKLCAPAAVKITVSLESSIRDFPQNVGIFYRPSPDKVIHTGNPFREELKLANKTEALKKFNLAENLPVLFITGGGTGAAGLNAIVEQALPELVQFVQVIHSTGAHKALSFRHEQYHQFPFIADMGAAYAAADIVVSRAGLSTITELSNLEKVSIIIPMPDSHQELNALVLAHKGCAIIAGQSELDGKTLAQLIRKALFDGQLQKDMRRSMGMLMPKDAAQKIADIAVSLAKNNL